MSAIRPATQTVHFELNGSPVEATVPARAAYHKDKGGSGTP